MADSISMVQLVDWVNRFAKLVAENKTQLTELDSAIGDADHGVNMARGVNAVVTLIDTADEDAIGPLFKKVGMTLVSSVGGASGPLYGTFFMKFGTAAGASELLEGTQLATALRAGLDGILARGKAEPGDKTMVDAMLPAVDRLDESLAAGKSLADALADAAAAADEGKDATIPMLARKGRASYLGERSIGHQDPGATSTAFLFETLAQAAGGQI